MARSVIAETVAAGNAAYSTIYTMPAGYQGFISNITAYNTTGGALNLTIAVQRGGVDYVIYPATSLAGTSSFYGKAATTPLVPITLAAGEAIRAQGAGAGINVHLAGMRFST